MTNAAEMIGPAMFAEAVKSSTETSGVVTWLWTEGVTLPCLGVTWHQYYGVGIVHGGRKGLSVAVTNGWSSLRPLRPA